MTGQRIRGIADRPGRVALIAGVLAGLFWVGAATSFALRVPERPAAGFLVYAVTGATYIVAGLVGWWLRPHNGTGRLLAAIGVAMFVGHFAGTGVVVLDVPIVALTGFHNALLAALLLSYPASRPTSGLDRFIVLGVAVSLGAGDLLAVFQGRPEVAVVTGLVIPLVVSTRIARRWVVASTAARRTLAPVLFGGLVFLLGVLATQVPRALDSPQDIQTVTRYVQFVSRGMVPIAFLIGLLRLHMSRSAVADLVVRLGDAPEPRRLREALSTALGDPTLDVVRWSRERGVFEDESGAAVVLPGGSEQRAVTVLERHGERLAALLHDPVLLDDPTLVHSVSAALRLAVDNERLQAEVRTQLEEVRASRGRIVEAGDAERRRVERDLHDGAQQRLVSLSLALRLARAKLDPDAEPGVSAALAQASEELKTALGELRELARGIHPAILTEAGLGPALQSLADRSPVPVELHADVPDRLPGPIEATAYFLVSEALANVAKHAGADIVRVTVEQGDGDLVVRVADDGAGGADPRAGSGLRGLEDRVAAVGGRLEIASPPQGGTTIVARIPTTAR